MEHLTAEEHSKVALLKPLLLPALLLMMMLLLFALPSRVLADQTDISINVIPSTLSFPPPANTPEHVDIEVSNLTTNMLQKLQLCLFTSANVGIESMQNGVPA